MINVTHTSREFSEVETYLMTIAPSIKSMKDVADGTSIAVAGIMSFEDVDEQTGEVDNITSIITPENVVYAFQSATFKRSLTDIANIMHGKPFSVIKTSGVTKGGRDFINCELDITKL